MRKLEHELKCDVKCLVISAGPPVFLDTMKKLDTAGDLNGQILLALMSH